MNALFIILNVNMCSMMRENMKLAEGMFLRLRCDLVATFVNFVLSCMFYVVCFYVVCCMSYVVCCMFYVVCFYVVCCMFYVVCFYVVRFMFYVVYSSLYVLCCIFLSALLEICSYFCKITLNTVADLLHIKCRFTKTLLQRDFDKILGTRF